MNTNMTPVEILLIEDSPSDVLMTSEALLNSNVPNNLHVVDDGVEAMAFLRQTGPYAAAVRPQLVLLDLNLPRKTGREVLAEIKLDPMLMLIPVIVLTTSKAEEDVLHAYGHHANCFISKPVDFRSFASVISSIEKFWFTIVTLPDDAT
jgi:CheY-like chemotaxis protein